MLSHPALTVKPYLGALTHVRRYFQVGAHSLPCRYLVHNSSINNLARGVLTRVFYVKGKAPVRPIEGIYSDRLTYFRDLIVKRVSGTTPVDYDGFVEYYKGRRNTIYRKAADSLLTSSVCKRDATIKAFVKAEFINSDDKPDPDPRVISPRDPRYNVEVGRFLRPLEHHIYRAIADVFGDTTVLKGFNSAQTGAIFEEKWSRFSKPIAIGLDASRFDQHVSRQALEWEHSVYNRTFNDKTLRWLLKMQLTNKVIGHCRDGKLKYTTDGCRMSGDMNTALGNCLIMCALVHCYAKSRGICVSLANNGDDCTVIMERDDESHFRNGLSDWFLEMGFVMKVEPTVHDIEGIEFCQTHPVWTPSGYIMVRNFPKSLSKDCLSLKQLDSKIVYKAWVDAVGQAGLSLCGGIPVFQEFYASFVRNASESFFRRLTRQTSSRRHCEVEITGGLAWMSKNMTRKHQVIHPRTRFSFWLAFGTTPDQQIELEGYYRTCRMSDRVGRRRIDLLPKWF